MDPGLNAPPPTYVIRKILEANFPEKISKISILYKKWMTPELKQLQRRVHREFAATYLGFVATYMMDKMQLILS